MHPTQNPVSPATPPIVADTLRRAALYLIRHGWTRDNHYANPAAPVILRTTDTFPAADVVGALVLAVTGRTLIPAEVHAEAGPDAHQELAAAMAYLVDWLGLEDRPGLDDRRALADWNDSPWQDQAHVVDGLLCAAADADGTLYRPDLHRPYAADFAALGLKAGAR